MLTDGPHGAAQAGAGRRPPRPRRERAGHLLPAGGRRSARRGTPSSPSASARPSAWSRRSRTSLCCSAPASNIKRSPLCGRNFEYLSEDPIVSGVLGAALVRGIQSQGRRCVAQALRGEQPGERPHARLEPTSTSGRCARSTCAASSGWSQDAQPWTVMCSYNSINGVYASEDRWLLTEVLRGEWGFEGLVVSDWGAVNDRIAAVAAGIDLEMPVERRTHRRASSSRRCRTARSTRRVARRRGRAAWSTSCASRRRGRRRARRVRSTSTRTTRWPARRPAAAIVLLKNDGDRCPSTPLAASVAVDRRLRRDSPATRAPARRRSTRRASTTRSTGSASTRRPDVTYTRRASRSAASTADAAETARRARSRRWRAASAATSPSCSSACPAALESEGYDRERHRPAGRPARLLDAVLEVEPAHGRRALQRRRRARCPFADRVPAILEALAARPGRRHRDGRRAVRRGQPVRASSPRRSRCGCEDTPAFLELPGERRARPLRRGTLRRLPLVRRARAWTSRTRSAMGSRTRHSRTADAAASVACGRRRRRCA